MAEIILEIAENLLTSCSWKYTHLLPSLQFSIRELD